MILARFREHLPMLVGAAILSFAVDGFILVYRLIGLPRATAVYAGLLTFVLAGSVVAQYIFRPRPPKDFEEDDHG